MSDKSGVEKQLKAVVVGASTLLGKELIEELNNSPAAAWDVRLLDEREDGETQLSASGDEAVLIQPLTRDALDGCDLVFFAGKPETTKEYAREAIRRGAMVVDLTAAMEGENGFLVRSPWLQGGQRPDLTTVGVISAHPAALMLAITADRLERRIGLEALTTTVLEPASQAGHAGLDELHQQTVSLLSFQSVPKEIYDAQVAFNLQQSLGEVSRVQLPTVRSTIRRHLDLLLGPGLAGKIRFEVVQAPVFHGYTISGFADLGRPATPADVADALNGGVAVADADTVPSNIAVTDTGDLLIATRAETAKGCWLWMAADNLRFGARSAVAAALELAALRPAMRVQ